jgi:hypothetical protein
MREREWFTAGETAQRNRIAATLEGRWAALIHEHECVATGLAMHEAGEPGNNCAEFALPLLAAVLDIVKVLR